MSRGVTRLCCERRLQAWGGGCRSPRPLRPPGVPTCWRRLRGWAREAAALHVHMLEGGVATGRGTQRGGRQTAHDTASGYPCRRFGCTVSHKAR